MKPGDVVKRSDWGAWLKWQGNPPIWLNPEAYGIVVDMWAESHESKWFWVMWQDGTVEKACNAWVELVDEA